MDVMNEPIMCRCDEVCGDLPEEDDDPRALCKLLPTEPEVDPHGGYIGDP